MPSRVFIALGSNVGDRRVNLKNALNEISLINDTKIVRCSSVYETEPWGFKDQNKFYNMTLQLSTDLDPFSLMTSFKNIEKKLGRIERNKWEERNIDIDILFYNNEIISSDSLQIPHPQIEERKFVLEPMNEIAPDLIHPVLKNKISQLLSETKDILKVEKLNPEILAE